MLIKILKDGFGHKSGEVKDLVAGEAEVLVKGGYAEAVAGTPPQLAGHWVELTQDFGSHKSGEIIDVRTADQQKKLIDSGVAKVAQDPTDAAVSKSIEESVVGLKTMLQSSATEAVVAALNDVRVEAGKQAKSRFGLPGQPRDHIKESLNGFDSPSHYFHAVKMAGMGRGFDQRLAVKATEGLNTVQGEEGGFLVPDTISSRVLEHMFETTNLLAETDQNTIRTGVLKVPAVKDDKRTDGFRRGGVLGYWVQEGEDFTKSKPAFREITLEPKKLAVYTVVTEEQLDDTIGYDLGSKLTQYAGEEIAYMVSDAIIRGNGATRPQGILGAPATVSIAKESGQTANLLYANLTKMYSRMLPRCLPKAKWYINQDLWDDLLSLAFTSSGTTPVFMAGSQFPNAAEAPFGTIFGRPIVPIEQCSTGGKKGDIIFADLSQYLSCTRGGIKSAMSMHVHFISEQMCYRWSFRVDGRPWMDAALTPAQGSNTQSAFVVINDRN